MGRKDWDNGAVFFVFVNDRKMRVETGYGLEGALPDQLAGRILDEQVRPRFRSGDWTGGLEAGIDGILAATRGEYKAPPPQKAKGVSPVSLLVVLLFVILFFWLASKGSRPRVRGPDLQPRGLAARQRPVGRRGHLGRRRLFRRGLGEVGGGFSGGGGSFGGGGASSSW